MRTIISEKRLRAMLEQMLQEQAHGVNTNEYIITQIEGNEYRLEGIAASRLIDNLSERLPAYGQQFENVARQILFMDKGYSSYDLNPDATSGTSSDSPFFDYIEESEIANILDSDGIVEITNPLVTVKATYSALDFSGKNVVKKIPKILDLIVSPNDRNKKCKMIKLKAGCVFVAANTQKTFREKKLVYDIVYTVPEDFNIGIILKEDQSFIQDLESAIGNISLNKDKIFRMMIPSVNDSNIFKEFLKNSELTKLLRKFEKLNQNITTASFFVLINRKEKKDESGNVKSPAYTQLTMQNSLFERRADSINSILNNNDSPSSKSNYQDLVEMVNNGSTIETIVDSVNNALVDKIMKNILGFKETLISASNEDHLYTKARVPFAEIKKHLEQFNSALKNRITIDSNNDSKKLPDLFNIELFENTVSRSNREDIENDPSTLLRIAANCMTQTNLKSIKTSLLEVVNKDKDSLVDSLNNLTMLWNDFSKGTKSTLNTLQKDPIFTEEEVLSAQTELEEAFKNLQISKTLGDFISLANPGSSSSDNNNKKQAYSFKIYLLDPRGIPCADITNSSPEGFKSFIDNLVPNLPNVRQHVYSVVIDIRNLTDLRNTTTQQNSGNYLQPGGGISANPTAKEAEAIISILRGSTERGALTQTGEYTSNLRSATELPRGNARAEENPTEPAVNILEEFVTYLEEVTSLSEQELEALTTDERSRFKYLQIEQQRLSVLFAASSSEPAGRQLEINRLLLDLLTEMQNYLLKMERANKEKTISENRLTSQNLISNIKNLIDSLVKQRKFEPIRELTSKINNLIEKELNQSTNDSFLDDEKLKANNNAFKGYDNLNVTQDQLTNTSPEDSRLYNNVLQDIMEAAKKKRKSVKRK